MPDSFMVSFRACHFLKDILLCTIFFYLCYPVSYHDFLFVPARNGVALATLWLARSSSTLRACYRPLRHLRGGLV